MITDYVDGVTLQELADNAQSDGGKRLFDLGQVGYRKNFPITFEKGIDKEKTA